MFKKLIKSPAARRRTSLLVAAVLILPFAIFFTANQLPFFRDPGTVAGVMFGQEVSWDVFQAQQLPILRRLEDRLGGTVPPALYPLVTQSTWDRLLLMEEARRAKLRVGNEELAAFIQELPEFQQDGQFLPERYHSILRASGLSPQTFEAQLREDLMVEKLVTSVRESAVVSETELLEAFHEAHDTLTASLVLLEPGAFADAAAAVVTEEEIRARYDSNPEVWQTPEHIMVEYAGRSREATQAEVEWSDEELRAFYDDYPDRFTDADGTTQPFEEVEDTIRKELTDDQVRKQLNILALDLEDDVKLGLPFDEIVATRGLTARSAGPIRAGDVWGAAAGGPEPAVLQALHVLPDGELSEVIETELGITIARITERIPAIVPPLAEVREQVQTALVQERARMAAKEAAEALRAKLTTEPDLEFAAAAEEAGVTPASVSFTRTDPIEPLGRVPTVNAAAFATARGELTDVLSIPRGFVLLTPEQLAPADEAQFAKEREALRERLLSARQAEQFETWMQELRTRAKLESFVEDDLLDS